MHRLAARPYQSSPFLLDNGCKVCAASTSHTQIKVHTKASYPRHQDLYTTCPTAVHLHPPQKHEIHRSNPRARTLAPYKPKRTNDEKKKVSTYSHTTAPNRFSRNGTCLILGALHDLSALCSKHVFFYSHTHSHFPVCFSVGRPWADPEVVKPWFDLGLVIREIGSNWFGTKVVGAGFGGVGNVHAYLR
jgi:hypothetical protein